MHKGSWETSKRRLECSGCNDVIEPGVTYMLAKFSFDKPDTNVSSLITLYLCKPCIDQFEEFAYSPNSEDDLA